MPTIQPEQCYKTLPIVHAPRADALLVKDQSVDELINSLTVEVARYSDKTEAEIKKELIRLIALASTYTHKEDLIEGVRAIIIHLQSTYLDVNEKRVIADKLWEGMSACAPGFHDRLNAILFSINRPKNIDELLERIRFAIVDKTARVMTDEVHLHTSFFNAAAALGYGVRPLNNKDVHSRELTSREAKAIDDAFSAQYDALAVFNELNAMIEGELRQYYQYSGKKSADDSYTSGTLDKIKDFLNEVLGTSFALTDGLFVLEESEALCCDVPVDIDWAVVQDCLWKKLRDEHYFRFTAEEEEFFNYLYGKEKREDLSAKQKTDFAQLFVSLNLANYPNFLKNKSSKQRVIDLFAEQVEHMNLFELAAYCSVLDATFDKTTAAAMKKEAEASWLKGKKNFKGNPQQQMAFFFQLSEEERHQFFTENPESFSELLLHSASSSDIDIFSLLKKYLLEQPQHVQKAILCPPNREMNLLMRAIAHPKLDAKLIVHLVANTKITPELRGQILTQSTRFGDNVLTLCAEHDSVDRIASALLELMCSSLEPAQMAHILSATDRHDGDNILLRLIKKHASWTNKFLATCKKMLDAPQIARMLTAAERTDGNNVLMAMTTTYTWDWKTTLELFDSLDSSRKEAILTQTNNDRRNTLMHILATPNCSSSDFNEIVNRIKLLSIPAIATILTTRDVQGYNSLMLFAELKGSLQPLIEVIKRLSPAQIASMLTATSTSGDNALILAVRNSPRAVDQLLKLMDGLDPKDSATVLTATTSSGDNILTLALSPKSLVVPEGQLQALLWAIKRLSPAQIAGMLTATTASGDNPLMLAVSHFPSAVQPLLELMAGLDPKEIASILMPTNLLHHNALKCALDKSKDFSAAKQILEVMKQLDPMQQKVILSATASKETNLLMLALTHHQQDPKIPWHLKINKPAEFAPLIDMLKSFDTETLLTIIRPAHEVLEYALTHQLHVVAPLLTILNKAEGDGAILISAEEKQRVRGLKDKWLELMIKSLDVGSKESTPLERALYEQLNSMSYNAQEKKEAIVLALAELRTAEGKLNLAAVNAAVHDVHSALYKALTIQRYPVALLGNSTSTRSYRIICKACEQTMGIDSDKQMAQSMQYLKKQAHHSPLKKELYKQLNSMQFNATKKKDAILNALDGFKTPAGDLDDALIRAALSDPQSALYKALDIRRYTFFTPLSSITTQSYRAVCNAAQVDISRTNKSS